MTRDEKIKRLRDHLNRHPDLNLLNLSVSVDGLQALFGQHDELKAQVERLLAKQAKQIGEALRRDANGDPIPWPKDADYFMAFDPANPDIPTD